MQNMEKYFGFRVRVSDFLEPEDIVELNDKVTSILDREPGLETQYRVYLHQLVLEVTKPQQFGVAGGLAGRLEKVHLRFSINPKQRLNGDIKFMNNRFERLLHEQVSHYFMPNEILYSLSPRYFEEWGYFQNTLITLVRLGMREQHKKIKIRVSVEPTPELLEKLVRSGQADAETNLDLDFRKAREFNRQTKLFTGQEKPMSKSSGSTDNAPQPRTIINVDRVGTLINDSSGAISAQANFSENPAFVDHLLHELRILNRSLQDDPPSGIATKDLAVVDAVLTDAPKDARALSALKVAGKWLGERAEKVGLTLLTEYLKHEAGL